ncbi:MAG: transposase [Cyanobacteria bacterium P01_A01_bin.83]
MQQAKLASVTQWRDLGAYALRFKLHLIINDKGELLAFKLTTCGQALCGNVDDRKPVPDMTTDIIGKLFGDRGYISQALFEQLSKVLPTDIFLQVWF